MHPDDFSFDLASNVAPPNHLGVTSGWSCVAPLHATVCGATRLFAPPFAAPNLAFTVRFRVDGHLIDDTGSVGKGDVGLLYAGGEWRCDRITRRGTYHHRIDGRTVSLAVTSQLVPLYEREGFGIIVTVHNRCGRAIDLTVEPVLQPGAMRHVALHEWRFYPPTADTQAQQSAPDRWTAGGMSLHLLPAPTGARLDAGSTWTWTAVCLATDENATVHAPSSLSDWIDPTAQRWRQLIADTTANLPTLHSDVPGLDAYYKRSIITGLVCIWDNPAFIHQPFLAVSGLDGGGVCEYMWDAGGYIPQMLALMLDRSVLPAMTCMADLAVNTTAMTPSGETFGHPYSYNGSAMLNFLDALVALGVAGKPEFEHVRDRFLAWDSTARLCGDLVDYGRQPNLLEMRGAGWEHIVASPNAERAWCYDTLARLAEHFGDTPPPAWRTTAERVRAAIRSKLWDADRGWFRCIYPDGHEESVYSIQAFDVIRTSACDNAMTDAILSHLRDGAFLGACGVSSVSREDHVHYELNDPDWSGGGAYIGEAQILAQTLYEIGRPDAAWDVLSRLLWMGRHLPYFPQEHSCDRPTTPAHKRANCMAGLAGAQAIIFGMAGVRLQYDGSIRFKPASPPGRHVSLHGLRIHSRLIDIDMGPERSRVRVDGRDVEYG